jgi:hypothetical protein
MRTNLTNPAESDFPVVAVAIHLIGYDGLAEEAHFVQHLHRRLQAKLR